MGRRAKRLAARQLTKAMVTVPPPVAKLHDEVLITTKTITAGRLGGILSENLSHEQRNKISSELNSVSNLLGKLRWGAGVLINTYLLSKLSHGSEYDMRPDLREVERAGVRRSGRTERRSYFPEDGDSDGDTTEAAQERESDVITLDVVHTALRCIMVDSNKTAPYKSTVLYDQLCTERDKLDMNNVLGEINCGHLSPIVKALAKRMLTTYKTHMDDYSALLANYLCVLYQNMYISRLEAECVAKCILTKDLENLPRARVRQTRWWYRGQRSVKRPRVTKVKWIQIVQEQRLLLESGDNSASAGMHNFYEMYQSIESFLLAPEGACKTRHVQLLPTFLLKPYYVPLTMAYLSDLLKRQNIMVKQDDIVRECFDFKKMNQVTGLRANEQTLKAPVLAPASAPRMFFHHQRIMRPEFISTDGYSVHFHTSSVLTKAVLLEDVRITVREQNRSVERNEIYRTIAKRINHFGVFNKSDLKGISTVLNRLLKDGLLVAEERNEKCFWSIPADAAMEVDAEILPAPASNAFIATTAARGISPTEPWIIVDPGENSVIFAVKASTVDGTDSRLRRGQKCLGDGQFAVMTPCLDIKKAYWKHIRRFTEIKKLKQRSVLIADCTCHVSRSKKIQEWQEVLEDYKTVEPAMQEHSKNMKRVTFDIVRRRRKGESDLRRLCKRAFGKVGKIAWGSGSWRKGQASGVLLKILQKDSNLRRRIQKVSEVNTSCKCSNCLDIPKMEHPTHHGREVWGLYQCQNRACLMTWHRDKGGTGGIFRRAYCSEFELPLPETYTVRGELALRKRPRPWQTSMNAELQNKR